MKNPWPAFLKRKRIKKSATQKEAAKTFRTLMRAGFGMPVTIKIVKNRDVDDELLLALQEEPAEDTG
jgi:SOS response regulatory protein OraA/RecX